MSLNINHQTDTITTTSGLLNMSDRGTVVLASSTAVAAGSYTALSMSFTGVASKVYKVEFVGTFDGSGTTAVPYLALTVPGTSTVFGMVEFPFSVSAQGSVSQEATAEVIASNSTIRAGSTTMPVNATWLVTMDGTGGSVALTASCRSGTANIISGAMLWQRLN